MIEFHLDPSALNHALDTFVAAMVEFKAFTLLYFLFGVCHMFLIWNGDILILLAVCGLVTLPAPGIRPRTPVLLGAAARSTPRSWRSASGGSAGTVSA